LTRKPNLYKVVIYIPGSGMACEVSFLLLHVNNTSTHNTFSALLLFAAQSHAPATPKESHYAWEHVCPR